MQTKSVGLKRTLFIKTGCCLALSLTLSACATSMPGAFVAHTFVDDSSKLNSRELGEAYGESCQTQILYLFPKGAGPSTSEALKAAKANHEGTTFLADVSIIDRTVWRFGYAQRCITVSGIAH